MKWTKDQQAAIEARGENLLLAAAAGSGKTTVLVERVATLLQEGADVREMLIVTFTRAAAADMRMSLIRRLTDLAVQDAHFRQQAEYAEYASISTIHSFCTDLLRAFFQAAGVDPAFRIADGPEESVLRAKALDFAMNQTYAADSPDHRALVCGRSPEEVMELSTRLYAFLMERPDPWDWLDQRIAELERGEDRFTPALCHAAQRVLTDARAFAEYACHLTQTLPVLEPFEKTAMQDVELLESMEHLPYNELRAALSRPGFARKPSVRGLKEHPDNIAFDQLRDQMKTLTKKARECLPLALEDALSDLPACAAELRGLREIVRLLDEEYTRLKDERSLLTFTDLERRTLQVLRDETALAAVRERYAYVFVDEYQDVSDIQEAILSRVAREDRMFSVGDVKQSIYRFRHAEPTLFMRKYDDYRAHRGGRLIVLNQNFRSRATVLEYANAVFSRAMQGGDSEIVYDDAAALHPGAEYPGEDAPVELHLIDKDEAYEESTDSESTRILSEMKDAEAEALLAARRMKELKGQPIWDGKKGEYRPLQWRDFVILTRQARDVAQQMLTVLRREGVPAYADVSGGYLDVMEVQVALALLRLVENRRRDPEWIAVLRAPNIGLSSEQLADIRARFPQMDYCDAVRAYAELGEAQGGALSVRLSALLHRLDSWRALSQAVPLSQLVFTVLNESGFYPVCGALPGGHQRQANLDVLCDRAASYEATHAGGLTGFLSYIEEVHSAREDMGEAHVLGENDDVVRIMTVHKSKGLEFPVVFGVLLGRRLGGGRRGEMYAHREIGVGLKHMDERLGVCRDTLPRLAACARIEAESDAEELRILYVMLTRARDRLILIGSVGSLDKAITRYRMSHLRALRPACYLDLLVPPMLSLPGGEELSDRTTPPDPALPHVDIRLTSRARLMQSEEAAADASVRLFDQACADEPDDELLTAYTWQYPHEEAVLLPLKLTASGISRQITGPAQPPELVARPQFLMDSDESLTGAERGTAAHAALQALELDALRGLSGDALHQALVVQLNALTERGLLTPVMRAAVRPALLLRFFQSDLGRRMLASQRIQREWMFTLRMTTEEALGIPSEEDVLVQGAVDLCFMEEDGWILLDYKTDRSKDVPALIERYRPQLILYAKALERITGHAVREIWLCLLAMDEGFYQIKAE